MLKPLRRRNWRRYSKQLILKSKVLFRRCQGWRGSKPDFVIIGAQKCGTSSLYSYLRLHPLMKPALRKEIHFFDNHYHKGLDWYLAHFPRRELRSDGNAGSEQYSVSGEASPYYLFHPVVPKRVLTHLPDAKLIVLLRNPIDRAYSQYHAEVRRGHEDLSFEQALEREPERLQGEEEKLIADETYVSPRHRYFSYCARGVYILQLQRWLDFFLRENILILKAEDLFDQPQRTVGQILEFLELPPRHMDIGRANNVGSYRSLDPKTRQWLSDYFKPYNKDLYEYLGADLGWD